MEKGAYFEVPGGDTLILSWPQGPDDDREVVCYLSIVTQLTLSVKKHPSMKHKYMYNTLIKLSTPWFF